MFLHSYIQSQWFLLFSDVPFMLGRGIGTLTDFGTLVAPDLSLVHSSCNELCNLSWHWYLFDFSTCLTSTSLGLWCLGLTLVPQFLVGLVLWLKVTSTLVAFSTLVSFISEVSVSWLLFLSWLSFVSERGIVQSVSLYLCSVPFLVHPSITFTM